MADKIHWLSSIVLAHTAANYFDHLEAFKENAFLTVAEFIFTFSLFQ